MEGRTNLRFESPEERRKRTCCRSFQLIPYVKKILARAEEAKEKGEFVTCILDIEGDQVNRDTELRKRVRDWRGKIVPGDIYYHHRRALLKAGVTPSQIRKREETQKSISANWRNKKPAQKIRDYFEVQANRVGVGLLKSDCHVVSISVEGDTDNECSFLLQATRLIETENSGEVRLPPIFRELLTHESIVFTNVGIFDDLAVIINAFYGGRLDGVKYVDLRELMADRWGSDAPEGLQAIFERAFPHLTLPKDKWITMGHWWISRLQDRQIEYALLDTIAPKEVLQVTKHLESQSVSAFSVVFPDRVIANRPHGLVVRDVSLEDGASLGPPQQSYPDFFLRVCQGYAQKYPALLPCDSEEGVHYLFRFTYEEWRLAEVRRKEELTMGSCEVDWSDVDGPSDPNRFKSTEPLLHKFMGEQMERFLSDPTCNLQDAAALNQWLFGAVDVAAEEQEMLSGAGDIGIMEQEVETETETVVEEMEVGASATVEGAMVEAAPIEDEPVEAPPTPSSPPSIESAPAEPQGMSPVASPPPVESPAEFPVESSDLPPTPSSPPAPVEASPVVVVDSPIVVDAPPVVEMPPAVVESLPPTTNTPPVAGEVEGPPVSSDPEVEILREVPAAPQPPSQAQAKADQLDGPDSDVEILDMEYEVTEIERNQVVSGEEDNSPSQKQVGPGRHPPGKTGPLGPGVNAASSSSRLPDLPSGRNDGATPSRSAFDPSSYLRRPILKVFPPPPVNQIERLAGMLKFGKPAIPQLLKEIPRATGPEALGYAAARFSFPHRAAARCLRIALTHFSSIWNDVEKRRFLAVYRHSGLIHLHTTAAVLRYEDWDPILALSTSMTSVLEVFEGREAFARSALCFYEGIWDLSLDARMALAEQQVFFHPAQQDQYLRVLGQGFLKTLMTEICRMYGWPLPQKLIVLNLPVAVSKVAKSLTEGKTSLRMAFNRLAALGEMEGLRPRVLQALSGHSLGAKILRFHLSQYWKMPGPRSAPKPHEVRCNPNDRFHKLIDDNRFVRTAAELDQAVRSAIHPAGKVLLAWHLSNDLRCPPDTIAVISFRAAMSVTTFHFFIIGEDAVPHDALRRFLHSLVSKPILAPAFSAIDVLFNRVLGDRHRNLRSLFAHIKAQRDVPVMDIATRAVLQQDHCPVHFDDLISSFADCAPALFNHLSATLFILEFFPWEEPEAVCCPFGRAAAPGVPGLPQGL